MPKTARVAAVDEPAPGTRRLHVELAEPLGFVGGQYVIVDSGLVASSGKAVKRAYSILSADAEQTRIELAVKRLPEGPCSAYMHGLAVGAEVRFSGPWGKLSPPEGGAGPTLVLATDTGVTAALGLVRGRRFGPLVAATRLVWLRPRAGYFLPDPFVRDRLPAGLAEVRFEEVPPIGHPERVPHVRWLVRDVISTGRLALAFIAGDGAVNYALLDDLVAAGIPASRDSLESFFNMPRKSE